MAKAARRSGQSGHGAHRKRVQFARHADDLRVALCAGRQVRHSELVLGLRPAVLAAAFQSGEHLNRPLADGLVDEGEMVQAPVAQL